MFKSKKLLLFLLILLPLVFIPLFIGSQESNAHVETNVFDDMVMPRLEAYGTHISEIEKENYYVITIDDYLSKWADDDNLIILDVREDVELELDGTIDNALHIPLRRLPHNLDYLYDRDLPILVICKSGFRGTIAMTTLHVLGYENAMALNGGFRAWVDAGLPIDGVVREKAIANHDMNEIIGTELVDYVADYLENLPEHWGTLRPIDFDKETFDVFPDLLLDVRSDEEWESIGYIDGATHIWINELVNNLDMLPEDKDANIVVYCDDGSRSAIVMAYLGMMGYTNVRHLSGGVDAWVEINLPLVQ